MGDDNVSPLFEKEVKVATLIFVKSTPNFATQHWKGMITLFTRQISFYDIPDHNFWTRLEQTLVNCTIVFLLVSCLNQGTPQKGLTLKNILIYPQYGIYKFLIVSLFLVITWFKWEGKTMVQLTSMYVIPDQNG